MDFFTTNDGPIEIKIDGKPYQLPRFLNPAMKAWAATLRKQTVTEATAHLSQDDKARFLMFFQPPAVDIIDLAARALSPDGAEYVCDYAMKAAGIPEDTRKSVIVQSPPTLLRALADELTTASRSKALAGEGGGEADPLSKPLSESGGSQQTSQGMTRDSEQPTPELIPTA